MTLEELKKIQEEHIDTILFRKNQKNNKKYKYEVMVCGSTGCHSNKSGDVITELKAKLKELGMEEAVNVVETGCAGLCAIGPIVTVFPDNTFYTKVKAADVEEIVKSHLMEGKPVERLLFHSKEGEIYTKKHEIAFYKNQNFVARANSDIISPESIGDYIALDGYFALYKALFKMTPEEVCKEVTDSGLRGRGGAGFPTGKKWDLCRQNIAPQKYVVCNADEGDPGAFMDRSIIESNPHAIVEAMTICGYAVGASQGYIYVRAEYPLAGKRLSLAIEEAKKLGLLGENIFGSGFSFDLKIKYGAGAFVCGEETALLNSVEGKRGEPRQKPPYPAVSGLFGCPTNINNVETYANIPNIINNGAEWFIKIGEGSTGTKVFALSGKINNTGLVELPVGSTLRDLIFKNGGGIPNGKKFKAVQMGGPSGGCISEKDLDTKIDYESLKKLGSMMGSGGVIVMDEDTCMVDVAKFFLSFTCDESCGKCTPCRVGTKRILELLTKITDGKGEMEDLDKLRELCLYVKENSLCGLGQSAPNPVLSALDNFYDEFVAHIKDKRCPAGVCKNLLCFSIDEEKCKKCSLCQLKCPVNAISGNRETGFVIDKQKCIKCGACYKNCRFNAIRKG